MFLFYNRDSKWELYRCKCCNGTVSWAYNVKSKFWERWIDSSKNYIIENPNKVVFIFR
jgi:hypothetical protein